MPRSLRANGAEILIRLMERQGIRTIAGIPGGANLPIYDALYASDIHHVLARHEQGAGFMAQGMARISGRPEVCFATSGPGATNLMTAVADAKMDSIPMVAVTGQVPYPLVGSDAFQEVDTYGMSIPITKHNFMARSAAEMLEIVPEAFRIAMSGRPGPVLIDMPKDVQREEIDFDAWPEPAHADPAPTADEADLARAAHMINAAERPVLDIGGGIIASGAADTARALAEKAGLPVTPTLMALGALPHDHPLNLGMLGMHAARCTNHAVAACDLLIVAGARFDDRATGKVAAFCPGASVIHIDIDAAELGKIRMPHLGIEADVAAALTALLPMVTATPRTAWLGEIAALRRKHPFLMPGADDPRTPYGLVRAVGARLNDDAIICTDVGMHQMWAAQAYPFRRPRRWLTSGGLGTMGFGLPAAIGAALADPEAAVVSFSGDGSLLMNIQELVTAAEEDVNVKVVVMNNNALGLVCQQQHLFYGNRLYASEFRAHPDFAAVARAFGVRAVDLATCDDAAAVGKALDRAFADRGPCLIHAPIDRAERVYPMVAPGAANSEMIGGESDATLDH